MYIYFLVNKRERERKTAQSVMVPIESVIGATIGAYSVLCPVCCFHVASGIARNCTGILYSKAQADYHNSVYLSFSRRREFEIRRRFEGNDFTRNDFVSKSQKRPKGTAPELKDTGCSNVAPAPAAVMSCSRVNTHSLPSPQNSPFVLVIRFEIERGI